MTCKHRKTWIINAGYAEWCYQCGAFRLLKPNELQSGTSIVISPWCVPVGVDGENPADQWDKRYKSFTKRKLNHWA